MRATKSTASNPLLIGGSSPLGCSLLGDFINTLPEYDCGPPSNIFCHPGIWKNPSEDWSKICSQSLQNLSSSGDDFLPWQKIRTKNFEPYYLRGSQVFSLLENSKNGSEFASLFFNNRLTVCGANSWAEATPENCFSTERFFNEIPEGLAIMVIENGYAAMTRLMKENFSPKVAAKIWVAETALATSLHHRHRNDKRILLLRLEDLLASPNKELGKVALFLQESHKVTSLPPLSGLSHLEQMSSDNRAEKQQELLQKATSLPEKYQHYLLGSTIKKNALAQFGFTETLTSGAELSIQSGYLQSSLDWEAISLSKEEQFLRSPRASYINPLVDFKKSKTKHKPTPEKQKTSLWKKLFKAPTVQKIPQPEQSPLIDAEQNASEVFLNKSSEGETQALTDLAPETSSQKKLDLAVVIGFLGRHDILKLVVSHLTNLPDPNLQIAIFLTCSNSLDFEFAAKLREKTPCIGVRFSPNNPLGRKWQAGVDFAREFTPRHLVITGSDDLVSGDFLSHSLNLLSEDGPGGGFEFAAPASWFIYEVGCDSPQQGTLWEVAYQHAVQQPLGAGRVYSSRLLNRIDWKLFDKTLNVGLDTFGYDQIIKACAATVLIPAEKGVVLSVKGSWQAMNSTEKILSVPTIQSRSCDFEKKDFFQKHFQTDAATLRKPIQHGK